jgi:hypothetical protein
MRSRKHGIGKAILHCIHLQQSYVRAVTSDDQTDEKIKAELNRRLEELLIEKDPGLTFEEVFGVSL